MAIAFQIFERNWEFRGQFSAICLDGNSFITAALRMPRIASRVGTREISLLSIISLLAGNYSARYSARCGRLQNAFWSKMLFGDNLPCWRQKRGVKILAIGVFIQRVWVEILVEGESMVILLTKINHLGLI